MGTDKDTDTDTDTARQSIAPHGGILIDRLVQGAEAAEVRRRAANLPAVQLSARQINDLELIAIGTLSPLKGFMGRADYKHAVRLLRPAGGEAGAEVLAVSALEGQGIDKVWAWADQRAAATANSGARDRRRAEQTRAALWSEIGEGLIELFKADGAVAAKLKSLEAEVAAGAMTPIAAARAALDAFRGSR